MTDDRDQYQSPKINGKSIASCKINCIGLWYILPDCRYSAIYPVYAYITAACRGNNA